MFKFIISRSICSYFLFMLQGIILCLHSLNHILPNKIDALVRSRSHIIPSRCCWKDLDEQGFNGIYLVRFWIHNVGDIDLKVISAAENSNKFPKTRFWKEKFS